MVHATIQEHGNGFPDPGDYVPGDDGELYRVISIGRIHTGARAGAADYMRVEVEPADWEDCEEGEEFEALAIVDEDTAEVSP